MGTINLRKSKSDEDLKKALLDGGIKMENSKVQTITQING